MPVKGGRRNEALTLLETLVALLIVAALAALLTPGINGMRKNAWKVKGIHHAKTLITGVVHYATEHKGDVPRSYFPVDSADPQPSTKWMIELAPYIYQPLRLDSKGRVMLDGTFRCPGLGAYKTYGDRWVLASWASIDWMNFLTSQPGGPGTPYMNINTRKVDNSKTPYIVSTDRNNGSAGLAEGKPAFEKYVPKEVWIYHGGIIVGYLDGHVEVVPQPTASNIFKK